MRAKGGQKVQARVPDVPDSGCDQNFLQVLCRQKWERLKVEQGEAERSF